MCDYRTEYWDLGTGEEQVYNCPHPKLKTKDEDSKHYCIFHSKNPQKALNKFKKDFRKLFKSGKHEFVGFVFPEGFSFQELREEDEPLVFVDANFTQAGFHCKADFEDTKFTGESGTNFRNSIFLNSANFRGAQFSGEGGTYFSRAKFSGEGETDFRGAQFSGEGRTDFRWAQFSGEGRTYFRGVQFSGEGGTDFSGAQFSGEGGTDFRGAQFSGEGGTYFSRAEFSCEGGTDFSLAKFSGEGRTYFSRAQFSGEGGTYFIWAQFSGEGGTYFSRAQFSGGGRTDFRGAQFSGEGETDFSLAKFSGEGGTDFRWAQFSGEGKIEFEGKTFIGKGLVDFRNVSIEEESNLIFRDVDLNRTIFLGTDLRKISFTKVFWNGRKHDSSSYRGRIKVYDEKFQYAGMIICHIQRLTYIFKAWLYKLKILEESPQELEKNHYEVYRLYNQLLENYEKTNRYHEAGDFFAGMMEMRRREKFEKRRIRVLLWFYRLFSLYGERPFKAFAFLLSVPLIFSAFYLLTGSLEVAGNTINYDLALHLPFFTGEFWNHYTDALMYSLKVMAMGKTDCEVTATGKPMFYLSALQIVLSLMFLSLFLLAMNRKFRRMKD